MIQERISPPLTIAKRTANVRLVLADGNVLEGSLFLASGERLQDVLNDPKAFLPFRSVDRTMLIVNKAAISVCQPVEETPS